MSFHCDKLCDGECCFHLLKALALVLRDHVTCARIPNVARGDMFGATASMQAHAAVDDPAKLAELFVLAESARGDRYEFVVSGDTIEWCEWAKGKKRLLTIAIWTMAQAREKLLAIMHTPADLSSREACEKILRGES